MKTTPVLSTVALLIGGASLLFAAPAFAEEGDSTVAVEQVEEKVCPDLDFPKTDVQGSVTSIVITAPAGNLITGYCVKAGSINNENGPVEIKVDPPVASLTITYPGGKEISHYSYSYAPIPTPTPTPTPTPETPAPTTPPAGGGDGGAKLAVTGFDAGWLPFVGIGALALGAALFVPRLIAKRR